MQTATANSVEAIKGIGTTICRTAEIATTIAAAVEEQTATTSDIARNVTQAAAGALAIQNANFDFGHVQLTGVLGRIECFKQERHRRPDQASHPVVANEPKQGHLSHAGQGRG
jgi:hypothetical protein